MSGVVPEKKNIPGELFCLNISTVSTGNKWKENANYLELTGQQGYTNLKSILATFLIGEQFQLLTIICKALNGYLNQLFS